MAGEELHLKCPVAGYPIEEVHWERSMILTICFWPTKWETEKEIELYFKDGRELPDDIRQKVQPDGSLIISPVQKTDDSGVYTCWARNKQGHSARRSGEVTVIGKDSYWLINLWSYCNLYTLTRLCLRWLFGRLWDNCVYWYYEKIITISSTPKAKSLPYRCTITQRWWPSFVDVLRS